MTLRQRLLGFILAEIAALALLLGMLAALVHFRLVPMTLDLLRHKNEALVVSLAAQLDVALAAEERELADDIVRATVSEPDFEWLEVRERRMKTFVRYGSDVPADAFSGPPHTVRMQDGALSVWAPIALEGLELGTIGIGFSSRRVTQMARWLRGLLCVMAGAFIVSTVLAIRFSGSFVMPLYAMMSFSKRVAEGELADRLSCGATGELADLQTHLNNMAAVLQERETQLQSRQRELAQSLRDLRRTQIELLESTRLASIGEMAGRTAHEILNPVTGIDARLTRMLGVQREQHACNLMTLGAVVDGWSESYERGGLAELSRSLQVASVTQDGGEQTLVEEDLDNLRRIHDYLRSTDEQTRENLRFLRREVDRIVAIVDGMRSLTRQSRSRPRSCLRSLLGEGAEMFRDSLREKSIAFELRCERDVAIRVDRCEFVQVVANLLRNAMLAIEEGDRRGDRRIAIDVATDEELAAIRIVDSGAGIKKEDLPRVFDSGFSTRGAVGGTGLGLSITRRLMRGFGGEIRVEQSGVGEGTTMLVVIPVANGDCGAEPVLEACDADESIDSGC